MSGLPVCTNIGAPTPLERFVQDSIDWLTCCLTHLFRGTCLEYWLLNPSGQAYTLFLTTLVGVSIWLLYLNQRPGAVVAPDSAYDRLEDDWFVEGDVYSKRDEDQRPLPSSPRASPLTRKETSIMHKLAPPGHLPTNAHLEGSPFRVVKPLGPRTGYSVAPSYQISFPAELRLVKPFSTRPIQRNNESDLAREALVSHQTLQGHADETPTQGKEAEKRTTGILGFRSKAQEGKPAVAYWSTEAGRNNGRATLRREPSDDDLA